MKLIKWIPVGLIPYISLFYLNVSTYIRLKTIQVCYSQFSFKIFWIYKLGKGRLRKTDFYHFWVWHQACQQHCVACWPHKTLMGTPGGLETFLDKEKKSDCWYPLTPPRKWEKSLFLNPSLIKMPKMIFQFLLKF